MLLAFHLYNGRHEGYEGHESQEGHQGPVSWDGGHGTEHLSVPETHRVADELDVRSRPIACSSDEGDDSEASEGDQGYKSHEGGEGQASRPSSSDEGDEEVSQLLSTAPSNNTLLIVLARTKIGACDRCMSPNCISPGPAHTHTHTHSVRNHVRNCSEPRTELSGTAFRTVWHHVRKYSEPWSVFGIVRNCFWNRSELCIRRNGAEPRTPYAYGKQSFPGRSLYWG